MQLPTDPTGLAVLDLEAQLRTFRTALAFLLARSPETIQDLEQLAPHASDIASQFQLTDRQLEVLQAEFWQLIQGAHQRRATLGQQ